MNSESPAPTTPDSHRKSVLKAVSWRVIGTMDTFLLAWLVTSKPVVAGSIAFLELATKTILYYFHERAWSRVR